MGNLLGRFNNRTADDGAMLGCCLSSILTSGPRNGPLILFPNRGEHPLPRVTLPQSDERLSPTSSNLFGTTFTESVMETTR